MSASLTQPHASTRHIPCATYRLQFNRNFTFHDATNLLDYLNELGITDCYASPLFKARPESNHGYDVCAFDQLNPNLGGSAGFNVFSAKLKQLHMGLIVDLVPNHMGVDLSNPWFTDVLQNGRQSPFASYFDIDWQPPHSDLHDKIILPILEDHYATVLEAGKLKLVYREGSFSIAYYDKQFPLSPESQKWVLNKQENNAQNPESLVQTINGQVGRANSFDCLHALLQKQHYRLTFWKVGPEEINYRRFFDVNELISVRMELPEVFKASHQLIFDLLEKGQIAGLRIDHPDGLWDPAAYLRRLQEEALHILVDHAEPFDTTQADQNRLTHSKLPLYIVAEKILTGDEMLPDDWLVDGTTGYDFLNLVNGLFVDPGNAARMEHIYREIINGPTDFETMVYECKKNMLKFSMASELIALTHRLKRFAIATRYGLDFTFQELRSTLCEVISAFPVYRTYLNEYSTAPTPVEINQVTEAVETAKKRCPHLDDTILTFIKNSLLLRLPNDLDERGVKLGRTFSLRFQQLTSPVMAKGLEDTAFYKYNRLISLNEVGGSPENFGTGVDEFHKQNILRSERWPHSMLTTATHDTKRGEDVRARINVLSEIPNEWQTAVTRWKNLNANKKTNIHGHPAPYPNDEYLLYQTLIGAWPTDAKDPVEFKSFTERLLNYMFKAIREAKTYTSWNDPDKAYEEAMNKFILQLLDTQSHNPFLHDFTEFQSRISFHGMLNSLSQILLRMTAPGIPDLYQGAELWDLSMVDPDNRRPVDFASRRDRLSSLKVRHNHSGPDTGYFLRKLIEEYQSGEFKMFTIFRTLDFRRKHRALFEKGSYVPLVPKGGHGQHVCSFARILQNDSIVVVTPRLVTSLTKGKNQLPTGDTVWKDTWLPLIHTTPEQSFRDLFTNHVLTVDEREGEPGISMGKILTSFPVALLASMS